MGRPVRLEAADGAEHLVYDSFGLGEASEAALLVPNRCHVAHLGEGEQSLVPGVVAGLAVEHVHVLGARDPLDIELVEAPELESLRHHRVQVPDQ